MNQMYMQCHVYPSFSTVKPLPDRNRPDVFAGEIGKPFTLSSQLVFGANSHLLQTEWFRGFCNGGLCQQRDSLRSNSRYQLEGTDLHIVSVNKSDGPTWYTQSIKRPTSISTENDYFFNFQNMANWNVHFIPFSESIPYKISFTSLGYMTEGYIHASEDCFLMSAVVYNLFNNIRLIYKG